MSFWKKKSNLKNTNSRVEIVLENCEWYAFDSKDVDVYLDEIRMHYHRGKKYNLAKHCLIFIKSNASPIEKIEFENTGWKQRIDKDITQVIIDGETYFVDWDMANSFENSYETDIDESERRNEMVYIISKTRKTINPFL